MKLVRFEMAKIWRKKKLLALLLVIILANILLHWYGNRSMEGQPGLTAYKRAAENLSSMSEEEKAAYLNQRAEDLENIRVAESIASWLSRKENTLESLSEEHQEIFKKWNPVYQEGKFLDYTDSLYQEIALIDELQKEAEQVTNYGEYLREMEENQEDLGGISIFSKGKEKTFSQRNIDKSREDYRGRSAANVKWFPGKGVTSAMDSPITGILYLVSIFLLAIWGMMEEKEKKLFYITRAADRGVLHDILARMAALGISCVLQGILLYGSISLFYGITTGFWNLSLDIQSVADYMQSSYTMTIGQFMLLSVLTKAVVGFGFGLLLQFVTLLSRRRMLPFLAGIGFLAANTLLYGLLPGVGSLSPLKYLNFIGVFHTENLYGDYLNFNIGGSPVSRTTLSLLLILFLLAVGCILVTVAFCRGRNFTFIERQRRKIVSYRPHVSLFRHECYKLFIANHGLVVILGCLVLAGGYYSSRDMYLSVKEEYYKGLMESLEGELTEKKEALLLSEKERYDNAFEKLEQINELEAEGKIGHIQAEDQRDVWNAVLSFYDAFQRVWRQYERIQERGGLFVYDTGYLYYFGVWGGGFLMELLVFVICILLVFSHSVSMEYQNKTNLLICSSSQGMGKILRKKAWLCGAVGMCLPACLRLFCWLRIGKMFPMHYWGSSIHGIDQYQDFYVNIPIWLFAALAVGLQILVCIFLALCVMLLSYWRKNLMQTILIGAVLFAVPLALYAQGVDFMKYLTVYPLYGWFGSL